VRPTARPIKVLAPKGWFAYSAWQHDPTRVVWTVVDFGPATPNWRFQPFVGPYHVPPGASLSGFQIVSDIAPDSTATVYAQGFDTIPGGAHTFGPRPPGNRTLWEEGYTGPAIVPAFDGDAPTPANVPASVGSADSLRGVKLKVRSPPNRVGAQVQVVPIPWPTRGSADDVERKATALAALFGADSLGQRWSQWIMSRPGDCEPFHGSSYLVPFTDYFLLRCLSDFEGGRLTSDSYLLGSNEESTVERLTWTIGPSSGLDSSAVESLSQRLVAKLTPGFGKPERPSFRSVMEPGSGFWKEVTRFTAPSGILYVYRVASEEETVLDSLVVMHLSARLVAASSPGTFEPSRWPSRVFQEVWSALAIPWPRFAAFLRVSGSQKKDLPAVREALSQSRGPGVSIGQQDLLRYAAHLWLKPSEGPPAWGRTDTAAVRLIVDTLKPFGVRVEQTHEGEWCYDGALAESVAMYAGRSRWADLAFIELMDRGWESPCAMCGTDKPFGPNLFQPVIERGNAYLAAHPDAAIAGLVTLRVAEAHETAWSLSKVASDDEYIDPKKYQLDAPQHREQALLLYEKVIERSPGLADDDLRRRLRRIRLDIDTSFHKYWCVWD